MYKPFKVILDLGKGREDNVKGFRLRTDVDNASGEGLIVGRQ